MFRGVRSAAAGVCEVACYCPIAAQRSADGSILVVKRSDLHNLTLACGKCVGCRIEYARQWTVRVMHEASLYEWNCFVTLTYKDAPRSLEYRRDVMPFIKKLRERLRERCVEHVPDDAGKCAFCMVRYFMCGEYGDEKGRAHYHFAFFNLDFRSDRYVWRDFGSGHVVYRSPLLESVWTHGDSSVGELTRESANYIARYVMKKVTGDRALKHYEDVDPDTGEVTWRSPEFTHMSLRPGIGADWFRRFSSDVFPHDRVVVSGRESKPPRYYDVLFKRMNPVVLDAVKSARVAEARKRWPDNTSARLAVREVVANARLRNFRRKMK